MESQKYTELFIREVTLCMGKREVSERMQAKLLKKASLAPNSSAFRK